MSTIKGILYALGLLIAFCLGCIISWKIYESVKPYESNEPINEKLDFEIVIEQIERGIASWYGHPFHQKRAADGSIFNMKEMTVASRTLPLGSLIIIENLKNGRKALATVTDRGPYVDGRVLDVSLAVAEVLGMVEQGVVPVEIKKIRLSFEGSENEKN